MPLEDFFTLTEMKDGLATLARVEELVGVMKEKENIIKYAGDAGRQWSTVASVLAATENDECLQHFIELDGLQFLDQWLQEAQKFSLDTNENFPEESINALLEALEKLPVDNELPTASGIGLTVKNLLDHRNFEIQQRARALYGNWNHVADESPINKDSQEDGPCLNELRASPDVKVTAEILSPGVSTSKGSAEEGNCTGELSFKHSKIMNCSDASQVEAIGGVEVPTSDQAIQKVDVCVSPGNGSSSRLSGAPSTSGKTLSDSSSPGLGDNDVKSSDVSELRGKTDCVEDVQGDMHVKDCGSSHPCIVEDHVSLPDSPSHSLKYIVEASLPRKIVDTIAVGNDVETSSEALQYPPDNGCASGTIDSPEISLNENEVSRAVDDVKEHASESSLEASEGGNFVRPNDISMLLNASSPKEMNKRNTDIELDYGEDDALEVARQVAKEVEREVVDYRGPFCSSSPEKNSEGGITGPDSPYSTGVKQDEAIVDKTIEINAKPSSDQERISGSPEAKRLKITKCEGFKDDSGSSPPIALPQELVVDSEKSRFDFDLNEEVCTEENDCPVLPVAPQPFTLAAPIPVVAVSKGVPTLPSTPLHFSGELGWKGSASTSAFHPPSPRKTPDGDKTSLVDASSNGSKQRQSPLKIDLNVAGDENEVGADLASTKHAFVPSSLPSRESSIEVCSRRAERPILDLNQLGDSDDTCLFPSTDWSVDGRFQNGHHSQSPASSSSSRPRVRNFDLNDNLFFVNDHVSHDYRQNLSKAPMPDVKNYGSFKLGDPIVSVMGPRIDVNRKELFNRATNAQGAESVFNSNLARLGGASGAQPSFATPGFGYSDLTVGPAMPFQLQMYGPPNSVPYMVDSRGASVIPHFLGSSTTIPAPSFSKLPFYMSLSGAPTDSSGAGFSQSGLDLNSGMALMDGERRDGGSFRQFFGNARSHSGSVEEQFRSFLHPAGTRTGMALKRKEPERGWELNMVGYKQ